ncbi:MAG TPA: AAA family ATPase [Planctomycetaceae bacterium]|jgi:ATP-dependent 26S proteasome regulatory subunit
MTLAERLLEYVSACFTGIWIESQEHADALKEIASVCRQENWRLAVWDVAQGLSLAGAGAGAIPAGGGDPLAAIRALGSLADPKSSALLVLRNFHRFLNGIEIVQTLEHQLNQGKDQRTFIVILAPTVNIPVELEKQFVVIEHELPGREQLAEIARSVATETGDYPEDPAEQDALLEAASGLTRFEAESACSLSLTRNQRLVPETLWELKSQMLKKNGLLTLHRGGETFDDLGGLEPLKSFCLRALRPRAERDRLTQPRGILLLSPPGCGKSQFCKALGNETGRPTLILDVGALMGSLVGQTEQNVRQALKSVDAMGRCVLLIDELEKALSGASGGAGDSGVSSRLFGTLLTWLSEHESDVFVACSSNDISKLPPEFSRAERFDGIFFLDLPADKERKAIWKLYLDKFGLDPKQPLPVDTDWTGAEIRSCCRLAKMLELSLIDAAKNVVPVARTAHESVERLRQWASGRCLSANSSGIYAREANTGKSARRVSRGEPTNN